MISLLKEVKNDVFLAQTQIILLYISTKKHLPIKQGRNQESSGEKSCFAATEEQIFAVRGPRGRIS